MFEIQNTKIEFFFGPVAITDNDDPVGAFGDGAPVSVDTAGYDFARVYLKLGATDIAAAAFRVMSGDAAAVGADDSTDNWAAITGTVHAGTTGDGRLPTAGDDGGVFVVDLDLRTDAVRRYLAVDFTAGNGTAGTYATAFVLLAKAHVSPVTNAERGIDSYVHIPADPIV